MCSTKLHDGNTAALGDYETSTVGVPFENDMLVPIPITIAILEFRGFGFGALPNRSRCPAMLNIPHKNLLAGFGSQSVAVRCEIEGLNRNV